jgi:hypothetical protein
LALQVSTESRRRPVAPRRSKNIPMPQSGTSKHVEFRLSAPTPIHAVLGPVGLVAGLASAAYSLSIESSCELAVFVFGMVCYLIVRGLADGDAEYYGPNPGASLLILIAGSAGIPPRWQRRRKAIRSLMRWNSTPINLVECRQ